MVIYINTILSEKFVIQLSLINYIVINTAILEKNVSREELPVESRNMVILIIKSLLEFIQFLTSQPTTIVSSLVHMTTMNIAENLLQYSLSEIDEGIGKLRNQKVFF
jgi:exportin-7